MTGEQSSRRRLLASGLALAGSCVAGCLNQGTAGGGLGSGSVISDTSISGRTLVVTLNDDHEISKLNLIGPDGSAFKSRSVQTGATQVEFELFDYRRGWHYSPGTHTLLALDDGDEKIAETEIEIAPNLEITDVQQYTGGRPTPSNRANLLVTVENTGTGPTWVYYIGYENALNPEANKIPMDDYARTSPLLNLEKPESKKETILEPGESREFLGADSPLLLSEDDSCDGQSLDLTIIASSGFGQDGKKEVRVTLDGEPLRANFRGTCSDIRIES